MPQLGDAKSKKVILATASYDHDIKFWEAHSGVCERTAQHSESVSKYCKKSIV